MNSNGDDVLNVLLRDVVQDQVPEGVDQKLRSQLARFRTTLGTAAQPSQRKSTASRRWRFWGGAIAAGVASLVVITLWGIRP